MQAGKLDQRILITRKNVVDQNEFGEDDEGTPVTIGTFCASVEFLQGRELQQAQQRWAEARYKICLRRQPGVTMQRADTITWNGQSLDILDVHGPGTRMTEWTIVAKDHVS